MSYGLEWLDHDPMHRLHAKKLELIRSGREVIDLSMINPDIAPPRFLLDKLLEATVRPVNHRYAVARGIRKLRDAFCAKYTDRFGVKLDGESNVCVTMGSKDAIEHVLMALGREAERVLIGAPAYPTFISATRLARMHPEFFSLDANSGIMLDEIASKLQLHRPRALILNFPNNPTGVCVDRGFYETLAKIVEPLGTIVLNDFVYGEMDFEKGAACSMLSVPYFREHGAEVYSLSKAYSVPGWRVGALLGAPALIEKLARLKAHVDYGIFLPIQVSAAAALTAGPALSASVVNEYAERANLLCLGLRNLGWSVETPRGGASLWAVPPSELGDSARVAERLLTECSVAVMPSTTFPCGERDSPSRAVRFALVASQAKLREVLSRLRILKAAGAQASA